MANGIQKPYSFKEYNDFFKECIGYIEENANDEYEKYLKVTEKQNECWENTRHRSRKWCGIFGCYVCLDCGCDYV